MDNVLVTGAAGFIGFHLSLKLLESGTPVTGLDNMNDYYDTALKEARLRILSKNRYFSFIKCSLDDRERTGEVFGENPFGTIVHLAAQPGVRYSLQNPHVYIQSNIVGFLNVLEGCRACGTEHLVYASTSSVYGEGAPVPFSEHGSIGDPCSLYAATKRSDELMAHVYGSVHGLRTTGLRFFTVYGPWGRPDMSYFLFTKKILSGSPIDVYNYGEMKRDFTYIDDIVDGIIRVMGLPRDRAPGRTCIFNIGSSRPVGLLSFIEVLEETLGRKAKLNLLPMQPGDMKETWADISSIREETGYAPRTDLKTGIEAFVRWYTDFYAPKEEG